MRDYLIERRKELNLSQQDVADEIGISRQYYSAIEQGVRQKRMDKDICRESEEIAGIVCQDLESPSMSVKTAETKIAAYAKKHGGCTPPQAADKILREFYGLPAKGASVPAKDTPKILNLEDFL